ncbi:hypothetical protein T01_11549 [Trichinella spiralis]|uniref:Uncharacterized protein n=1 Tax=Trichinella spiralis TaxID=6334 RepID=A0A0V1BEK1_TRISP|nr:hypothetical protein T01_11549 [Trichinella spiralis]
MSHPKIELPVFGGASEMAYGTVVYGHSTTSTIVKAKSQVSCRPPSEDDDTPSLRANGSPAGDQTGHLCKKMIEAIGWVVTLEILSDEIKSGKFIQPQLND